MTKTTSNKQQRGKPADRSQAKRATSIVRNGGVTVLQPDNNAKAVKDSVATNKDQGK